jgi:hypothetical protein
MEKIKPGVPQGSILGPLFLFYFMYINDLPKALDLSESYLLTEDTSIYDSNSDITQLELVLNTKLEKLNIWIKSNKLSVNINKTNCCMFRPRQKKVNLNLYVQYDNQIINQKRIKFLWVYIVIDEHLCWIGRNIINYIKKLPNLLE